MATAAAVVAAIVVWANTHAAPTTDLRRPFQALGRTSGDCMSLGDETEVPVAGAPCVQCVCRRGALVCRLQVCPVLPDPPPPSCIKIHRRGRCCPSLQCISDVQQETPQIDLNFMQSSNGCFINGSTYAEGSALLSSSLCEHCYCIGGRQRCLKPQCVLSVAGCRPQFRHHSCCPSAYECQESSSSSENPSTWPAAARGCLHAGRVFTPGEAIPSSQPCQRCFCLHGQVRCSGVLGAPILSDCTPVVLPGECRPHRYDCTNSNDGNLDPVSKIELHLESNGLSERNQGSSRRAITAFQTSEEGRNHGLETTTELGTTEDLQAAASNATTAIMPAEDTTIPTTTMEWTSPGPVDMTTISNTLDDSSIITSTELTTLETTTEFIQMTTDVNTQRSITEVMNSTETEPDLITSSDVDISIEQKDGEEISMTTTVIVPGEMLAVNVTLHSDLNISVPQMNATSSSSNKNTFNTSRLKLAQLEPILLLTEKKEREEAETSEDIDEDFGVSLPPSLPNVRIIPFLVEDAVLEGKERNDDLLSENRQGDMEYYKGSHSNLFSPPQETEGGFVPKEGFLDGTYYDTRFDIVLYESTETESPTVVLDRSELPSGGVVVPPVTVAEGIATPDPFRDVIRTEPAPDLPSLIADLQLIEKPSVTSNMTTQLFITEPVMTTVPITPVTTGAIYHANMTLNRTEYSTTTRYTTTATITTTKSTKTKTDEKFDKNKEEEDEESGFSLKNMLNFFFDDFTNNDNKNNSENITEKITNITKFINQTAERRHDVIIDEEPTQTLMKDIKSTTAAFSNHSNHLLKVAGCNIYGRMYAVGRIITELTSPCLQCMCTEQGVQCRGLGC